MSQANVPVIGSIPSNSGQAPRDVELARLAAGQHGLVTFGDLRRLGFAQSTVSYQLRMGRLHRVQHGVYAVGHARLSPDGRGLAAVLSIGPGAVLSHVSAAVVWGLLEDRGGPAHVSVARQVRSRRGIRVHSVRRLDACDRTCEAGIPVTTAARTILDLAETASEPALRRAVRQAQVLRRVNERELRVQLDRARGRRGAPRLAALIADGPAPTRSELEDRVLELLVRHSFPRPAVNAVLEGFPRRVEVDFMFEEARVILEADGARYHDNRLARRADVDKQAMLEAAGYRVVRLTWSQVTRDVEQTVRRLRRVFATQGAVVRRPPVSGTDDANSSAAV
jgi:hypothetical protein